MTIFEAISSSFRDKIESYYLSFATTYLLFQISTKPYGSNIDFFPPSEMCQ